MQVNGWFSEAHDDTASITMGRLGAPRAWTATASSGAALDLDPNIRFLPALSKVGFPDGLSAGRRALPAQQRRWFDSVSGQGPIVIASWRRRSWVMSRRGICAPALARSYWSVLPTSNCALEVPGIRLSRSGVGLAPPPPQPVSPKTANATMSAPAVSLSDL